MRWLKRALFALLCSLALGLLIGTAIRWRLERTRVYIGLVAPGLPLHVGDAGAPVLHPRHHEQQVG